MTKEQTGQILNSGNAKDPHYYTAWDLVTTAIENLTGYKRVATGAPTDEPIFVFAKNNVQKRYSILEALQFVEDTIN